MESMDYCDENGDDEFSTNTDYGEKYQYDPNFKGPTSRRSPTDVNWFVGFVVFTAIWITVGVCIVLHGHQVVQNNRQNDGKVGILMHQETSDALKETLSFSLSSICNATVICLILIYLMRWIAAAVFWTLIALLVAYFIIVSVSIFIPGHLIPASIFGTIAIGIIVTVYVQRVKIAVSIALIKEGSKAVASSYTTLFLPIIPLIFQIVNFTLFIKVCANIQYIGTRDQQIIRGALFFLNMFGFLWVYWFIGTYKKMVLAHIFSSWYWTLDKKNVPYYTHTTSAVVSITRYHLGTIALASFFIPIIRIICYIFRKIMKIGNYCIRCPKIRNDCGNGMFYLNKNTYIMVANHGYRFWESTIASFNLLQRNITNLKPNSINNITFLQFGVFNIAIAFGMGGLFMLSLYYSKQHVSYRMPYNFTVVGSFIVANTLFGIYSTAIDTLFICFLEDIERNDGSELRPFYMSKTLMKVLHRNSENLSQPRYEHF
ncbi:CTL-like protein 2 [Contarinia nasturtii]|uniref:CTL-like protein 2 n=1 Tax=Contarinia nasturtii TaxID=265458 RepID=UPI0012D468F6|nr:CTL-like protein 2 [Contarinia nasturtii]XP_031637218.1 CTL-like protein 2 [Contarinia nasturtii]XP_031637219.1 CTL-like protein 2 [Contarinia nasturtii]XP_031637220.1 CTL-like protein 2 [Contarinia nasturtii]XP_031637221.1 CTL-like protein 2 [Contarinia nasturtii]XP_031637222.1 CTL-like protein 2 [Contarinia nasturtii]XP_031637224.1 CTL-like protein 2 [Contarinia nasturtii]XP_031637225.1 CTL-like protein 2 [Contarinia nasturtii]